MRKRKWYANISKIRGYKTYNTKDLASVLGCSTEVLYNLVKGGLPYLDGSANPYYFDGREVKIYLEQMKKTVKAKPNEFRCQKCKKLRESIPDDIDLIIKNKGVGNFQAVDLIGKCNECGSKMTKFYTCEKAFEDFTHLKIKYNHLVFSERLTIQ